MKSIIKLYESNKNSVKELCLISPKGEIITFLSNYEIDNGDKNRIASSIMANIALGTRATKNLTENSISYISLKGKSSTGFIVFTKKNNYLYLNIRSKYPLAILKSFEHTINDILTDSSNKADINNTIVEHGTHGLYLVPANLAMSRADLSMSGLIEKDHRLRKSIKKLRKNFDFVLVDCPPPLQHYL